MLTIRVDTTEIEGPSDFEFVVDGERRLTVSITNENMSVQIPDQVDPRSIVVTEHSFFLRTRDRKT